MNNTEFKEILEKNKNLIDSLVNEIFDKSYSLYEPLVYALDSGKRIRANLYLETLRMLGKSPNTDDILFALGLEMIHAYSLVHDDLPAMDDDDLRRGKASLHIKFGEDIAILTGDALLNEASSLLFDLSIKNSSYIRASKYVFEHTGYKGMVEGQVLDLRRDKIYDKSYLLNVYDKKTADLFKASIVSAGLVCNLTDEKLDKLCDYAYNLGLAYQIQDDLLEDNYKDELNILNIMNEEKSRELLYKINFSAKDTIKEFTDSDFLLYLIDYLSVRKD
jgi:possible geranyltranstransferase